MFRSVSQDADDAAAAPPAHAGVGLSSFGRRRTRAQAKIEIHERREKLKRTREAMEAMAGRRQPGGAKLSTPPRTPRGNKTVIKVGASFGENLAVEHTPPRSDALKRRLASAGALRTPEKPGSATTNSINTNNTSNKDPSGEALAVAATRASRLQARGIAQSGSSGGGASSGAAPRKRMISFSPERSERPINEEAERQKRQRNLKATEKLQLRLDGPTPSRTPEKPLLPPSLARRNTPTPTKSPSQPPQHHQTPQQQTPQKRSTASPSMVATTPGSHVAEIAVAPSPTDLQQQPQAVRSDTPDSITSTRTLELPSCGEETEERAPSRASSSALKDASCKKELDFTVVETADLTMEEATAKGDSTQEQDQLQEEDTQQQQDETMTASQEHDAALSQPSAEEQADEGAVQHRVGFGASGESFTSTSTIEDVGLFNCELDVEFTGGVYGEGTDGKVSAAMVRGQKVALKRAKPHDGYPEEEAKRRSAVELHYLRRVRHVPGFLQCLGLCDGIEHTCIALEVMDCKLSDYLRRYGQHTKPHKSGSSKRRCFTLSLEATKAMLKQICQPMSELHDTVNVAHGDLACRNILLRLPPKGYEQKWEPVVKLSDFGRIKTPASEPPLFGDGFSFYKNCDIGAFAREILYRLLVGEIVPTNCTETRTLHKHLQDVVVERIPEPAKEKLGPYYRLFMRCAGWGVRPSFREIVDHLDDLEYFETSDNGYFPLKPSSVGLVGTPSSSALETASFLSPMVDERARHGKASTTAAGAPSSGSKNKYETPTTANPRGVPTTAPANTTSTSGVRMLPGKSFTDGPKQVNWLKARSVHPGGAGAQPGGQPLVKPHLRPTTSVSTTAATQPVASTPVGNHGARAAAAMPRKTPPSAGASRRSLQIINQFQHRLLHEKEKKKC